VPAAGRSRARGPLLAPEDAGWVGFDLAEELVDRAGLQVVIAMPSPVAVGPVQTPVMGVGVVAQLSDAHLGPFGQVRMPRCSAFVDADLAAADRSFNADLVPEAGRHAGAAVLADPGDVGLWRCGHSSTLEACTVWLQPVAVGIRTHPSDGSKIRLARSILLIMSIAATPVPLSEAKARLSELARRVRQQHERITLTRNGEPEAVLLSVDDLEGLEMTLEILGDADAVMRISQSLAALERGEQGADLAAVRQDLARRRVTGA
jgi:antitoxin YefM